MQAIRVAGADTLLLRRTYPELETSIILPFRRDVPWRDIGATFNEAKHTCYWPNGSTTRFGYCDSEKDVYQYQGGEFNFIGVDELTMFTLSQWQFLTSRNRCRVPGARPCMAGATNPGNIGHAWVKALWVEKRPPAGMDGPEKYNPADCSRECMQLILLVLSRVLHHGFAWYLGLAVPYSKAIVGCRIRGTIRHFSDYPVNQALGGTVGNLLPKVINKY